ncbi:MAG TPA: hypothetical protein PL044_03720 [Clostridiales bacterium]|nr:hypothetical protein [Clostridiales bacterium]HQK72867.1 hypothetical protein [Clostridiales bacterium]
MKQWMKKNISAFAVFLFLLLTATRPPQFNAAVALCLGGLLALCAFTAWIFNGVIKRADEDRKASLITLTAILLAGYASHPVLSLDNWYKDSHIFAGAAVAALFFLSLYAVGRPSMAWRIPVYCALAGVIEPLFLFTFLPAVLLALAEKKVSTKNKSGRYTAALALAFLLPFAAFLIFGWGAAKRNQTDPIFSFPAGAWRLPALSAAVLLPAIVLAAVLWISILKHGQEKKAAAITALALAAPVVSIVSLFIRDTHVNFIASAVFSQFCLLIYFADAGNKAVLSALEAMEAFFKKNRLLFYIMLIYLAAFAALAKANDWRYFWF